jgi:hypothetical protein
MLELKIDAWRAESVLSERAFERPDPSRLGLRREVQVDRRCDDAEQQGGD